ncbi:aminoglycoside phosphotransferase family protein [Alkalicoccus luteus]|uniref:Aminoglycoside phosphotransferase family protein n=1 Tax=Alkalicoccus luteus TaxID=1237094 RepID=A0A969TX95_9BACI|nr:aminoglycoside phosphotransferase family protein [Alkalicoccus luteus]NJP38049.1 aminoglycoside phosphotransferase family protein [Alkalicoccus luteus]
MTTVSFRDITRQEAEHYINEAIPDMAPVKLEHTGTGFDTIVYAASGRHVFRFPRHEKGWHSLRNEKYVLHLLKERQFHSVYDVPVPFTDTEGTSHYPFTRFSYVPGRELASESNTDLLGAEAERIASFLIRLHDIPVQDSGLPGDELKRLSAKKRKPMLEEILRGLKPVCPERTLDMARGYLREIPDWENPQESVLVHGDLHPKNLIACRGRLKGIIDWGDAHIGHRASDLALVYQALPDEAKKRFFEWYGAIDDETEALAVFKAVFVSAAVGRAAYEQNDKQVVNWCRTGMERALRYWFRS